MTENTRKTTIVIGAGIVGAAISFELQRRGHRVTLVDKGEPGRGTSFGNMASIALDFAAGSGPSTWRKMPGWLLDPEGPVWLRPSYAPKILPWFLRFLAAGRPSRLRQIEDAGMALSAPALADFRAMLDAVGAPELMTEDGCLAIYETEAEFAGDRGHLEMMQRYGFEHSVVSGADLRALEPALSPHIAKAVLLPNNKSIRNPYHLVLKLVDAAKAAGTGFVSGEATMIERRAGGGVTVMLADGRRLDADDAVVAAGVPTRVIAKALGEPIPLETERGYHTQIMAPGISMRHSIIWPARAFMVTPTAGGIRVGGNVELAGLDAPPDYRRPRVLVRHAQRALPGLKVEEATDWMGHRPSLPDTIPIISASSRLPGVWYATGHGHLGLTYSATTARLMADMIGGMKPSIDMTPFRINRY
ncbi:MULTISPECIES: NAD(P)/FAD-dependent oxidoreductase [unclassified Rhizobium]|uniref:NAD(P)/FAD-dependent oxidoreductase n=1 Tax=unclassified Rhizobium TaxID=2613769 RepID=UPI001ADC7F88|nr:MULTISPECIES: FAD-binding oxidoreductase [unclassified Rhizobium]MBO9097150.1 FAD-binding oxidoreductase [Rhizobium sp. L58/93]MBO9133998.1 FAD-binding oxidoreductase [Rhizobium sp. B209b/85]MBO9167388.1 FAD-binding oxidoreductase [Rhizobium sp. L245/93]MBO9183347.1 FAD-binding oxidoreductase [Rhizobium sp. E27B/91]QXZ83688.1 FAD-binding oxidoreductase [Rhizobium sp. K1/93]